MARRRNPKRLDPPGTYRNDRYYVSPENVPVYIRDGSLGRDLVRQDPSVARQPGWQARERQRRAEDRAAHPDAPNGPPLPPIPGHGPPNEASRYYHYSPVHPLPYEGAASAAGGRAGRPPTRIRNAAGQAGAGARDAAAAVARSMAGGPLLANARRAIVEDLPGSTPDVPPSIPSESIVARAMRADGAGTNRGDYGASTFADALGNFRENHAWARGADNARVEDVVAYLLSLGGPWSKRFTGGG